MTAISMYKISVPIFVQFLTSLSAVLDKAAALCEAKKIEPTALLNMRLAPDMYPLVRQVRAATDHAVNGSARLAGVEPRLPNTEASFAELKERIAKTIDFVKGLKPAQIDGTEDKEIKITLPSGASALHRAVAAAHNSLPNFYFHCTTAYDILRHCGSRSASTFHGHAGVDVAAGAHPIALSTDGFHALGVSTPPCGEGLGVGVAVGCSARFAPRLRPPSSPATRERERTRCRRRPLDVSGPGRANPRRCSLFDTMAVTSTSTIIPGQASWLMVRSVWAGSGLLPNASTRHLP